jgi:D-proline reductase (dithiol) PrdB
MQNAIETAGIATVSLSLAPHITLATGVPRALYVRFPFGDPFGEPGDVETQRTILKSALEWLYEAPGPNQVFRLVVSWRRSRRNRPR